MIYSSFINKTSRYLKSVRILQNYVSIDLIFPKTWVVPPKLSETVEVLITESNEDVIHSFVCENKGNLVDFVEQSVDMIIKSNIEREEKERLFKSKVNELKSIFENENLENLKGLKFDMDELTKLMQNKDEKINTETTERNKSVT